MEDDSLHNESGDLEMLVFKTNEVENEKKTGKQNIIEPINNNTSCYIKFLLIFNIILIIYVIFNTYQQYHQSHEVVYKHEYIYPDNSNILSFLHINNIDKGKVSLDINVDEIRIPNSDNTNEYKSILFDNNTPTHIVHNNDDDDNNDNNDDNNNDNSNDNNFDNNDDNSNDAYYYHDNDNNDVYYYYDDEIQYGKDSGSYYYKDSGFSYDD